MSELEQGTIEAVEEQQLGDELVGDVAIGDIFMLVSDADDFEEAGGQLLVDDELLSYSGIDDDAGTLWLTSATTAAHSAGTPVWVAPDARERIASVRLDEDGEAITARVPHALYDRVPEGVRDPDAQESVLLELDDGEWIIDDVLGASPVIDASFIEAPLFIGYLPTEVTIPSGGVDDYTTVLGWAVSTQRGGMTYDETTGEVIVSRDGWYSLASSAVMWQAEFPKGSGTRVVQPYFNTVFGIIPGGKVAIAASDTRQSCPIVTPLVQLSRDERVLIRVQQDSGGPLQLIGDATWRSTSFWCVEYRGPVFDDDFTPIGE